MNRRSFLLGAGLGLLSIARGSHLFAQPSAPTPKEGIYPVIPDVSQAWSTIFSNINEDTILTEPVTIFFWVFVFDDEENAIEGFEEISDFYHAYVEEDAEYPVRDRSVGRLGDERRAYFDNTSAPMLATIVRVGSVVQASLSLSLFNDPTEYVADFLPDVIPENDDNPSAFIPDIADLPIGWESAWDEPIDITAYAQGVATPAPTPRD